MDSISGSTKRRFGFRIGSGVVRFGTVSLLAVLLAVSLLPLTQSGASAADDEPLIVNAELVDEPLVMELAPGSHTVCSRATDAEGNIQPEIATWNRKGYQMNAIQPVEFHVR